MTLYHLIFIVKIKNNMTVCILGNNLTALTLAKALVTQNIYVDILYNKKNLHISKTRTIGISKSNIDYLNKYVVNIEKILWKLKKIEIFSDNLKKEKLINFKKDRDQIFSMVKNCDLYQILESKLFRNKFFKSKFITYKNLSFINKYDLIINCDSSNVIAKKYFSKKIVKEYDIMAHTTIIVHEKILNDTAIQIFTNKGPLAFLPISDTKTSIVYSISKTITEKKENIERLIKCKNFKYKIKSIEKIKSFKLKSLNLRSYYHGNILAFGDLLHKVHPLAGQGFNMTIRDIKILLDIIKKKSEVGLLLDKSVNIEFENKSKYKNLIFSNGVDLIHEFFNIERKTNSKFLSKSVQLISKYPPINKIFAKIADRGFLF
jgi:2-octaprenyl-6-methoxyphenol hydroxylase